MLVHKTQIIAYSLWQSKELAYITKCWQRQFMATKMLGDITCPALRSASLQRSRLCCIFLHWNVFLGSFPQHCDPHFIHVMTNQWAICAQKSNPYNNAPKIQETKKIECSKSCLYICMIGCKVLNFCVRYLSESCR